jgi:DNA processing protein
MRACDACLRRAHLIGLLSPRVAGLLERPGRRPAGLLGLPEDELLAAIAGSRKGTVRQALDHFRPDEERGRLAGFDVHAVCRHDASYPRPLGDLEDPPAVLFSTATSPPPERDPAVTVVGTRAASPYGLEVAYELGRGLGAAGVTVVSGLALGIDAAAHRGCLDAGGFAAAVLGGGVDIPYPLQNLELYRRLREEGAVLSEMPPGQRPYKWSFPARNRIMAGLAQMTLLVEAADPSGSLITAEFARDLGRAVAAVPGRVTSRVSVGTNGLLRDGAIPVTSAQDVLDELFGVGMRTAPAEAPREPLDPGLEKILAGIEGGRSVGELADFAGLSPREARAALARLEAQGLIVRSGLGTYERTATPGFAALR